MAEEIDYEKVDNNLLSVIMTLNSLQQQVAMLGLQGTARFVDEIDEYRKKVGAAVQKQGTA